MTTQPWITAEKLQKQALGALEILLQACPEALSEGDTAGTGPLQGRAQHPHIAGLVTLTLRIVVLLFAEARGLLPLHDPEYAGYFSILVLRQRLASAAADGQAAGPGAGSGYQQLQHICRAVHQGVEQGRLRLPARGGQLFDSAAHPRLDQLEVDDATLRRILDALGLSEDPIACYRQLELEALGSLYEFLLGHDLAWVGGRCVVVESAGARRHSGAHYTPRSLARQVVRRTLDPVLAALGPSPSAHQILALRICDPAMGSGAVLLAACRYLASQLIMAWRRDGAPGGVAMGSDALRAQARREVAQNCLFGVDKSPVPVELAKLSLWLMGGAAESPFTFLDHALLQGDSLVGLDVQQLRRFHWQGRSSGPATAPGLNAAIDRVLRDPHSHPNSEDLSALRWAADQCVRAFFSGTNARDRDVERKRRLALVEHRFGSGPLGLPAQEVPDHEPVFHPNPIHWWLAFPQVFLRHRPMVKADSRPPGVLGFDAVIGNPPFLGGRRISAEHGTAYAQWLAVLHGSTKSADLCAHFFRRSSLLLAPHGTLGLISPNTIGQGDTRTAGLQVLKQQGWTLYQATTLLEWPGTAAVRVALVHLARPALEPAPAPVLDGIPVTEINSRLQAAPERRDPHNLLENRGRCFQGSITYGMGFTLSPAQREALILKNAKNSERIYPYLGGEEVNSHPQQEHHRYVIDFGMLELERVREWPDLLAIVEARVKPERQKTRAARDFPWWRFWRPRSELYAALKPLRRCLVTNAQASKHLIMAFCSPAVVFANSLNVFPTEASSVFAVLQSRVHDAWCWRLCSFFGAGIRYNPSDCFECFPFPTPHPETPLPELERLGEALHQARVAHMRKENYGLTRLYNALKDPACAQPELKPLRDLHEALDCAVLNAYGWGDLRVPPYCPPRTQETALFEQEVTDRLYELNRQRSA